MLNTIKKKITGYIFGERVKGEPIGTPTHTTTMPIKDCTMSQWENGEWIKTIGTIEMVPTASNVDNKFHEFG